MCLINKNYCIVHCEQNLYARTMCTYLYIWNDWGTCTRHLYLKLCTNACIVSRATWNTVQISVLCSHSRNCIQVNVCIVYDACTVYSYLKTVQVFAMWTKPSLLTQTWGDVYKYMEQSWKYLHWIHNHCNVYNTYLQCAIYLIYWLYLHACVYINLPILCLFALCNILTPYNYLYCVSLSTL